MIRVHLVFLALLLTAVLTRAVAAEDLVAALTGLAQESIESARRAEKLAALLADNKALVNRDLAQKLIAQGDALRARGNFAHSLELYRFSEVVARQLEAKAELATALHYQGIVLRSTGSFEEALTLYRQALAVREALNDRVGMGRSWSGIGLCYRVLGDYEKALAAFQKGLALSEAAGDRINQADALNNIGVVYRSQASYAEALVYYRRALALREKLNNRTGAAATLNGIGMAHLGMGDTRQALECFLKCLPVAESTRDPVLGSDTLNNLGMVYYVLSDYDKAVESFEKSLQLRERMGDRHGISRTLLSLGATERQRGRADRSRELLERALKLSEASGVPGTIYACNLYLGHLHRAAGRIEQARACYERSIEQLERIRARVAGGDEERLAFQNSDGSDQAYESLVSLLLEQSKTAEALQLLERARSKQLLDGLRLRSLQISDTNLRQLFAKTEDLEATLIAQEQQRLTALARPQGEQDQSKVANLTALVATTRGELRRVTNAITDANPDYGRLLQPTVAALPLIQGSLPTNVVALEYLPLDTSLLIFVVTREGTQARSVAVSRARLEELVATLQRQVERVQRAGARTPWDWGSAAARPLRDALTALYGYLVAPVQSDLAAAESVVVVPHGLLHYLPFQALAREDGGKLRFLVEDKPIAVLPSLTLWTRIVQARRGESHVERLAAFGNPDGSLPAAEEEVKRIAALFTDALVFTGAAALRAQLKKLPADISIAHFATHAALGERSLNDCYLQLANGDKLKLGDIYDLAGVYPARMTVLSACETAAGRRDAGNEFGLLADGFVEAGSTTIIASLWKVSDASTALLMEQFYKELKAGRSRAEAKRRAELVLLRDPKTAHPYYWAPFVLIGDWR